MRGISLASQDAQQQRQTLLMNHEIAAVECALRYNSKWTVVPRYYGEDDRTEQGKHDIEFRQLRHTITKLSDWPSIDPLIYLGPFLKLIKASDVSGPITGTAALAIQRILRSDFFSSTTTSAAEAINQIVEDATMCKFESTNNAQDEIVLLNIVQVLGIAVECDAGLLLTDDAVCKAFRASFMLGNPETKPKEYGDIMSYYSRQSCGHMLRTVFNRLRKQGSPSEASTGEVPCQHGLGAAMEIMDFLIDLIKKDPEGVSQGSASSAKGEYAEDTILFALHMIHTALMTMGKELVYHDPLVTMVHVDLLYAMCQSVVNFTSVAVINAFSQIVLSIYAFLGSVSVAQIEVVLERVLMRLAEGKGVSTVEQKEAALEGILDLCRQPGFVHDIFVNCDCRLERCNLFEDLCTLISKAAFPSGGGTKEGLSSSHLVSLETLIAIFNAINSDKKIEAPLPPELIGGEDVAGRNTSKPPSAPPPDLDLPCFVDVWTPMVKGEMFHLGPLIAAADAAASNGPLSSTGPLDLEQGGHPSDYGKLRSAVHEKHMKQKVSLAVDHFNRDFKKGFQFLQASKLMPLQEGSPGALKAAAEAEAKGLPGPDVASEAELAACLGRFLRACPGLNKTSIGELLGEPADFYLKVLDAFTQSFDFRGVKFDAAIRLYLESFRLPGEAQKINRIINSFGHYYFIQNQGVFKNEDAAYVLAYSVIMLNTDRHNSQVKNKMTLESFRRNLRGCNDNTDFPPEFLDDIYNSIVSCALKLNETSSMDVSEQAFLSLHQTSRTERGRMVYADAARHLFDSSMFQLMWGPAVHAMCGIVSSSNSTALETALDGLVSAAHIAMYYGLEDVVDSIVINLSKIPSQIVHVTGVRPDLIFGKDTRMKSVTQTLALIANRHGDCLMAGWSNVMELIIIFYRLQMLPDTFAKALKGDGEGGLQLRKSDSDLSLRARRAAAKAQANSGSTLFKSITSMLSIPAAEEGADRPLTSEVDRILANSSDESLTLCHFEDIFTDSKFLKQESLVHLVKAIVWASGSIPRQSSSGPGGANWDVSELCLELLFTVLLRNRDRISFIWQRTYDHFHSIFVNSKDLDRSLVQKAIMGMLRLCQRLLPYKTDISEPLLMGIQLVSLVDEQVALEMAPTIATEVLSLLKSAAPYIQQQPVWISLFGLLRSIQFDTASFPLCVETASWVVKESLTPLNFSVALPLVVELLERAVPDMRKGVEPKPGYPQLLPELLNLLLSSEEWLELWWLGMSRSPQASDPAWLAFKEDAWVLVVNLLCRVIRNPNNEVRSTAVSYLQRSVVAAEKLGIAPSQVLSSLTKVIIPMTNDLSKLLTSVTRDFIHCDATVHELIRAIVKVVLLFADALPGIPGFGAAWRSILDCLSLAMANGASKSEVLSEAIPEALKNMLLVLKSKGNLKEGWRDSDGTDLSELTWKIGKRISVNLTPASLVQ